MFLGFAINCSFINNSAGDGGAIFGNSVFEITADNCIFVNNSANEGGAIYQGGGGNCTFIHNYAEHGGAMLSGSAKNCIFINNSAEYGGALQEGYALDCIFINNYAEHGGAIYSAYSHPDLLYLEENEEERIFAENCTFINNSAKRGGALFGGAYVQNCDFINNSAQEGGAACNGLIVNCNFINNSAEYGGAISLTQSLNCTFKNNIANKEGENTYKSITNPVSKVSITMVTEVNNGITRLKITLKDSKGKIINGYNILQILISDGKHNTPFSIWIDEDMVGHCYSGHYSIEDKCIITLKGVKLGTYKFKIFFKGSLNYLKSTKSVKLTIKATPKLTAAKKTFKKSTKIKKYTVTLKNHQNKVMKNTWITLKVNKKTYKVKTNTKGQATFKITNLNKKGTYTAVVKYAGNSYYYAKTVKPKIIVK